MIERKICQNFRDDASKEDVEGEGGGIRRYEVAICGRTIAGCAIIWVREGENEGCVMRGKSSHLEDKWTIRELDPTNQCK